MQTAVVILIVAAAAVYVGRVFIKGFRKKQDCACGCAGCAITDSCDAPPDSRPGEFSDRNSSLPD